MIRFLYCLLPIVVLMQSRLQAQSDERYAALPAWYNDYDVTFYRLDLSLSNRSTTIRGNAGMRATVMKSGLKHLTMELSANVTVDSIEVNGRCTKFSREGDELFIEHSPAKGDVCDVTVYYTGSRKPSGNFFDAVGCKADSWDVPVTWTMSEPYGAKTWYPCKQYLRDKADSAYVFITVPKGLMAGAPGNLTAVVEVNDSSLRYEWKTRYPIAYYLLSMAVSDYQEYTFYAHPKGVSHPVKVQNFIYNKPDFLEQNRKDIDSTAAFIELFSDLYLPYPFADEKYGHCSAPMGGGMEHQTMTTISDFSPLLIAHELSHQWFGDMVTCASFQDIWLNEGFASYNEYLTLEHLSTPAKALEWLKDAHQAAMWDRNGSVFVPAKDVNNTWRVFSMNLSYKKGAVLVHQLRLLTGNDELFFKALRTYLDKYKYSTASVTDFKQVMTEVTGKNLDEFFRQWYYGEGFPQIDLSARQQDGYVEISVTNIGSSSLNPLFTFDLPCRLRLKNGSDTTVVLPICSTIEHFKIAVSEISGIDIDPAYTVLKTVESNDLLADMPTHDDFVNCPTKLHRGENLTVTFGSEPERKCNLKLTDAKGGKTILSEKAKGRLSLELPTAEIANGTYLLYVTNGKTQYVRKIKKRTF